MIYAYTCIFYLITWKLLLLEKHTIIYKRHYSFQKANKPVGTFSSKNLGPLCPTWKMTEVWITSMESAHQHPVFTNYDLPHCCLLHVCTKLSGGDPYGSPQSFLWLKNLEGGGWGTHFSISLPIIVSGMVQERYRLQQNPLQHTWKLPSEHTVHFWQFTCHKHCWQLTVIFNTQSTHHPSSFP